MNLFQEFNIPRYCLPENVTLNNKDVKFQLHCFCDASNSAFCCVVYLRCLVDGKPKVSFVSRKSRLVLTHQANWVISRKEIEATKICSELMSQTRKSIRHIDCGTHFWTDSMVVFGCISNPDLKHARFVKRRVDCILCVAPSEAWKYANTTQNLADVGTRETACKNPESVMVRRTTLFVAGKYCCLSQACLRSS